MNVVDYPWLSLHWQRLVQLTESQKLPHAFLFIGSQGIGKKTLVQAFEALLLCQQPTLQSACGECRSCYLQQQGLHPDSRRYGEQDPISIDDIRELKSFIEETPHQNGKKVVCLFGVDKLQTAQANALLKMVEEPQDKTVLLLVANKGTILPTLKSRCFIINIPIPASQVALAWLVQQHPQVAISQINMSLYFATGAPLQARALLAANLNEYEAMISALLTGNVAAFDSAQIQEFILSKPLAALYLMYYFLADLLKVVLKGEPGYLYNDDQSQQIAKLKMCIPTPRIVEFIDNVNESIKSLALPGVNKSLLFESLFCQWQLLCQQGIKHESRT